MEDHLSAIYQRYFLIWARRLTNTMFNGRHTTGTCSNEPARSFAGISWELHALLDTLHAGRVRQAVWAGKCPVIRLYNVLC